VIPVVFTDSADTGQGIVVSGQQGGQDLNEVTVHIALPAVPQPEPTETPAPTPSNPSPTPSPSLTPTPTPTPSEPSPPTESPAPPVQEPEPNTPDLIAAPVITSPVDGARLTQDGVTFAGTGVPGVNIAVAVVPTSVLDRASASTTAQRSVASERMSRVDAQANAAAPIVVDSDGYWSVRLSLPDGEYTATAVHVSLDATGVATAALSEPSAPVTFRVAAAPAGGSGVIPPATQTPSTTAPATSRPATDTESLAATGIDGASAFALGLLLSMAGGGILLRRRLHPAG
jgi:hypothetical protein